MVPAVRIRALNDAPVRASGTHVLYWMTAYRRLAYNQALEHAAGWARKLGRGLIVLEALRVDYPFASDRLHRFVADGMAVHDRALADSPVAYHPYLEPRPGAG